MLTLIAQFLKCDFWNPGEILSWHRWKMFLQNIFSRPKHFRETFFSDFFENLKKSQKIKISGENKFSKISMKSSKFLIFEIFVKEFSGSKFVSVSSASGNINSGPLH